MNKLIIALLFASSLWVSCSPSQINKPKAKQGVIDLSNWDFQTQGMTPIIGEWEFYWNQLITPSQIKDKTFPRTRDYITVPGLWNDKTFQTGKAGSFGYGTYRLLIHKSTDSILALKFGRIETAHKIWINGRLLDEEGKVGINAETMIPKRLIHELHFSALTDTVELIIQVSNFKHRKGGISQNVFLGQSSEITATVAYHFAFEAFILGVLMIMFMYHIGLFFLRKKDIVTLFFGLTCFFTALNSLTIGEILLVRFFPNINWELLMKIDFISNYLRLVFFVIFLSYTFPKEIYIKYIRILYIPLLALCLVILVTPAKIYSFTLMVFMVIVLLSFIYLLRGLILATLRNKEGAIYSLIGCLLLLITVVNDMLYDNLVINSLYLVPAGLFIFIFFQSFMLAFRFTSTLKSVEKLSHRLLSLDKIKNELLANTSHKLHNSLRVISQNINADKSILFLLENEIWNIRSYCLPENQKLDFQVPCPISEIDTLYAKFYDKEIFEKVIRKADIFTANNFKQYKQLRTNLIFQTKDKSAVLCIPIIVNEIFKGIIYFENSTENSDFSDEKINVIELLSSQLITLIDNATIFEELERMNENLEIKVQQRTVEIIIQKEEIEAQRDDIESKNNILNQTMMDLAAKNRDITDSIKYAKRIQESVLPNDDFIKQLIPDSFILYKPRDILSGDFYWLEQIFVPGILGQRKVEKIIIAAVDCTGHGVPGALMSIIGNNLLNYAVNELNQTDPSQILETLDKGVQVKLKQTDVRTTSRDGMDIALISYEPASGNLMFAGAKNPLYLIHNNAIQVFKGDKNPIGGVVGGKKKKSNTYSNHSMHISKGDVLYLFSDGYADQTGGRKSQKFMYPHFREILLQIHHWEMKKQLAFLEETLNNWKVNTSQVDDILVMGIRF